MKLKYKVEHITTFEDGSKQKCHSAGAFASFENAKKALKKYRRISALGGGTITSWRIYDITTGQTIEQCGRI